MPQSVRDVMTPDPRTLDATATVQEAARAMRDDDIGDVIVCKGDAVCGIVTDRDVTIRAVAEGRDPATTKLGDICSRELVTLSPDDSVEDAIRLMRERALRRLPVLDSGKIMGILSLGDLAIDLDRKSVLADISAAPANT
jgi:CBS domain-containing protein